MPTLTHILAYTHKDTHIYQYDRKKGCSQWAAHAQRQSFFLAVGAAAFKHDYEEGKEEEEDEKEDEEKVENDEDKEEEKYRDCDLPDGVLSGWLVTTIGCGPMQQRLS